MVTTDFGPLEGRARIGWWAFVLVLAAAASFIAYSFVGILTLGVFGYYATRPIYRRLGAVIDSDGLAASATILLVLVPILVLLVYVGVQAFQEIQQVVDGTGPVPFGEYLSMLTADQRVTVTAAIENPRELVTDPRGTLGRVLQAGLSAGLALVNVLLMIGLAVTLSYFLLKNDEELSDGLRQLFGGRDTVAYAYASRVDDDLESVFFGNFLFVVAMAVIAAVVYWGTNLLAPAGLSLPMIFVLAVLTGAASLLPIVVGKVVYLPAVGYLALQAVGQGGGHLAFVGGVLVVYFLVLDILPQMLLQPYMTSRRIDVVVLLFAYLLGPVLFGWYGFFFLPIVFVLMFEVVRIVLPELVHGDPLTATVSMGDSTGTDPRPPDEQGPDGESEGKGEGAEE